jgi:glycosyltransferase involved in cell wall biosynthesis
MSSLFSIITPSYNQARFIRQTIQSVLDQGVDSFEHIVVDGGSNDGTVEILRQHPHLRWVSEPDRGQSDALNKGLRMSHGRLIVWINSDDFLAPGALKAVEAFFREQPQAAILCGNSVWVDKKGAVFQHAGPRLDPWLLRHPWRKDTSVFQPGVVFRSEVYEQCGPFDVRLHLAMDYEFFLRATERFQVHHRPIDIGCFRVHGGTKTGEALGPAWKEVKAILPRHLRQVGRPAIEIAWVRLRLHLCESRVWICDGMNAEQSGRRAEALRLYGQALLRNPLNLFCYPHLCFRLRQLFGPNVYEHLRGWKRWVARRPKG